MVMGQTGHGPKWLWVIMTQEPGVSGAGSLLYKGHMIHTFVISGTSDYCHR